VKPRSLQPGSIARLIAIRAAAFLGFRESGGWHRVQVNNFSGVPLIVLALSLLGAGETDRPPAGPLAGSEAVSFLLIKGQLMSLSPESCVIKDSKGEIIGFKVDEQTSMVDFVHEGDLVEVYASPEGLARSVFKAL
jgi:hypothetical protein